MTCRSCGRRSPPFESASPSWINPAIRVLILALGALLVGASFLYQRYFRPYSPAPADGATEDPPASDGAVE